LLFNVMGRYSPDNRCEMVARANDVL